jgi:hypothetical protein
MFSLLSASCGTIPNQPEMHLWIKGFWPDFNVFYLPLAVAA